jgi:hypothetical protein
VYGGGRRKRFNFSIGQYTTVFQAEVYVIMAYAIENMNRDYKERII